MNQNVTNQPSPNAQTDLEQINRLTRAPLGEEDVYIFPVVLCDNEIDRDFERFTVPALKRMAQLFVGVSGIFDHSMKGKDQVARIFCAQVEEVPGRRTRAGEPYHRLYARAYLCRTEENRGLVAELDAGIKKEVSVGCRMERTTCSVCGADVSRKACQHRKGQRYGTSLCHHILDGASDAYEWSFVAVPAQPGAGVVKAYQTTGKVCEPHLETIIDTIKSAAGDLTLPYSDCQALAGHITALEEQAKLGELYQSQLKTEVSKLCALTMPQLDMQVFGGVLQVMTTKELQSFKKALEAKSAGSGPTQIQLHGGSETQKTPDHHSFKI
ncbi:MAG: hypothetical protein LIO46_05380 [Clostridiales bacterium]|nr:hypothetical protein [Clostridiales bacterium]